MENREIVKGIYKHFKGKLYRVLNVCSHTETKETMIFYQSLYGNFDYYVRSYKMFASEVDKEKYPLITQKYRFELVYEELSNITILEEEISDYYKERNSERYYKTIKYLGNYESFVKVSYKNEKPYYEIIKDIKTLLSDNFLEPVSEEEVFRESPNLILE